MSNISKRFSDLSPLQRKALIAHLKKNAANRITPQKRTAEPFVVSFAQQRLWFLQQWAATSAFYNVPQALRLQGRLDVAALQGSLAILIERHEALRTTFPSVRGEPVQRISPASLPFFLPVIDLSSCREREQQEEQLWRVLRQEADQPFDLQNGPLVRATLFRLSEQEHVLLLVLHHIVTDEWSMS